MRNVSALACRISLVVAAATVAEFVGPGVAHADVPNRVQPFRADSGDACTYGYTQGSLAFGSSNTPWPSRVDLWGTVADRPLPADPGMPCADDGYFTVASYTAFAGDVVIERETRLADNGVVSFRITLGDNSSSTRPIDLVVIQVCRYPQLSPMPTFYCGYPRKYVP